MATRIDRLSINAFRGATCSVELKFDSQMPMTLIFGENGTGKSTIVDAIDFVCNGALGSLENCKLGQGQRKASYLSAVGKRAEELLVEINSGSTSWVATHSPNGAVLCNTPDRPQALVLRRAQLLNFVDADPADRYKALAKFISIPGVEKAEQELRQAEVTADRDVKEAVRAKEQAEEELKKYWEVEGKSGADYFSWARSEATKNTNELQEVVKECSALLKALEAVQEHERSVHESELQYQTSLQKLQLAETALKAAQHSVAEGSADLLEVLKTARAYLDGQPAATSCPVCERDGIEASILGRRLDTRISVLGKLDAAVQTRKSTQKTVDNAASMLTQTQKKFSATVQDYTRLLKASALPEVISHDVDWSVYSSLLDNIFDHQLITKCKEFISNAESLKISVKGRGDVEQKRLNQLNAIRQHIATITEKTESRRQLDEIHKRLQSARIIVEQKRKEYIDQVLEDISTDADGLYSRVHPDEPIGSLRIYLDPSKKGSLKFAGRFQHEADIQPQAYYSESHLDTLGICVFLALAKLYSDKNAIIVLDDIFTSVDQPHLDRIITLLHDQTDSFSHIILTTHYEPWRKRYLYHRGPALKIQMLELLPWSLKRGLRHSRTKLIPSELRDHLNIEPIDKQLVSSKAGILLEDILDHLTLLYECKMPRRAKTNYALGDLLAGMNSKLLNALKVFRPTSVPNDQMTEMEIALRPLIDSVGSFTWVRNSEGGHFNIDEGVSNLEVMTFGKYSLQLAEALVCDNCGELPKSVKSGIDHKCRCGRVRLCPYRQPE